MVKLFRPWLKSCYLNSMLPDIIALILLVMAVYKGFRKGLIVAIFSFLAFIIGLAAALKLSAVAANYIGDAISLSQRWLPVVAFLLVFLVVVLLVKLGAVIIEKLVNVVMLGWVNRLGGILFFVLIYFFIYSIVLFYAAQLGILKPAVAENSFTYNLIAPLAPAIMNGIGMIFPFFRDMFEQLLDFFQGVSAREVASPTINE